MIDLRAEDTELVFNLWAFADKDTGYVYALSGRAYRLGGDDASKVAVLKALSFTDFRLVKRRRVPKRFKLHDGDQTLEGYAATRQVNDFDAQLFEEIFVELEKELPPLVSLGHGELVSVPQTIPADPLSVRTIIIEDRDGKLQTVPAVPA